MTTPFYAHSGDDFWFRGWPKTARGQTNVRAASYLKSCYRRVLGLTNGAHAKLAELLFSIGRRSVRNFQPDGSVRTALPRFLLALGLPQSARREITSVSRNCPVLGYSMLVATNLGVGQEHRGAAQRRRSGVDCRLSRRSEESRISATPSDFSKSSRTKQRLSTFEEALRLFCWSQIQRTDESI
jgi:hypothetical protein